MLTHRRSREPGPGACSLCEYVFPDLSVILETGSWDAVLLSANEELGWQAKGWWAEEWRGVKAWTEESQNRTNAWVQTCTSRGTSSSAGHRGRRG